MLATSAWSGGGGAGLGWARTETRIWPHPPLWSGRSVSVGGVLWQRVASSICRPCSPFDGAAARRCRTWFAALVGRPGTAMQAKA